MSYLCVYICTMSIPGGLEVRQEHRIPRDWNCRWLWATWWWWEPGNKCYKVLMLSQLSSPVFYLFWLLHQAIQPFSRIAKKKKKKKLLKTYFANALVFYVGAFHSTAAPTCLLLSANDGWLLKPNLRLSLGQDFELSPRVQNDSVSRNWSLQKKLKM